MLGRIASGEEHVTRRCLVGVTHPTRRVGDAIEWAAGGEGRCGTEPHYGSNRYDLSSLGSKDLWMHSDERLRGGTCHIPYYETCPHRVGVSVIRSLSFGQVSEGPLRTGRCPSSVHSSPPNVGRSMRTVSYDACPMRNDESAFFPTCPTGCELVWLIRKCRYKTIFFGVYQPAVSQPVGVSSRSNAYRGRT